MNPPKPKVIVLDVYETLLDMSDIERRVNDLFNSTKGYALWFEIFMQYCFVDSCTGQFHAFPAIAKATMQMTAQKIGRSIKAEEIDGILERLKYLPLHEDTQQGLSLLADEGFRLAALTNTPEDVVCDRMESSGLISYFELVLSAESIKKYKPSPDVYHWAIQKLGVLPQEALLVSAHGWDIAGACCAGLQTAYLQQNRQILYPLAPTPNFVCKSLEELAGQLSEESRYTASA